MKYTWSFQTDLPVGIPSIAGATIAGAQLLRDGDFPAIPKVSFIVRIAHKMRSHRISWSNVAVCMGSALVGAQLLRDGDWQAIPWLAL